MICWVSGWCVLRNWMSLSVEVMFINCTSPLLLPSATTLVRLLFNWVFLCLGSNFQEEGNHSANSCFKVCWLQLCLFFSFHESSLVMKWLLAQMYWPVLSLSMETMWNCVFLEWGIDGFLCNNFLKSQCYWSSLVLAAIKASCHPCWFSWRVLLVLVDGCLHAFVLSYPVFGFYGV